jgi:myo-inositol-1(or 4)-monophosphatase
MRERLFAAGKGQGATLNGETLRVQPKDELSGARVLGAKPNFDPRNWPGGLPDVKRDYRPSLAYRLSLVGQGRFAAMLTLRDSWEWDIAAGSIIVTEAGGHVSTRKGAPLLFNKAHPVLDGVVAGTPPIQAGLLKHLGAKSG